MRKVLRQRTPTRRAGPALRGSVFGFRVYRKRGYPRGAARLREAADRRRDFAGESPSGRKEFLTWTTKAWNARFQRTLGFHRWPKEIPRSNPFHPQLERF